MTDTIVQMPDTFDFGKALRLLKGGHRIARKGWNGKGMFVYLNKGSFDGSMLGFPTGENPIFGHSSSIDGIGLGLFESGDTGTVTRLPNINMRSASGAIVTGWLASQTDMLATDWMVAS